MLAIKLAQTGKTNKKMFRVIISEKSRDPYGRVLEILGSYNPHSKELSAKTERIKYWLSKGAQMTATVNNLLIEKKIIEGKKAVASKPGKKKKKEKKKTTRTKAPDNTKKDDTKDKPESVDKKPVETEKRAENPTEQAA